MRRESLTTLLGRTDSALDEALEHARLPFEQIVEAAHPPRDLSRTPLFQVLFGFEEEWSSRELPGVTATRLDLPVTWTPHDIDLYAVRRDGELSLRAHFNTSLFDRATVEQFLDRQNAAAPGLRDRGPRPSAVGPVAAVRAGPGAAGGVERHGDRVHRAPAAARARRGGRRVPSGRRRR
ncbi:hypothetical protein SALBM217S_03607 [Streptomyces griseoloalbus]